MYNQRQGLLSSIPPVTKVILIINVVLFILSSRYLFPILNIYLPIFSFKSDMFHPYQLITHMFMHGGFTHLFFNMFALFMFGRILEQYWGSQRFFLYYFVTGLGAALLHLLVIQIQANNLIAQMNPAEVNEVVHNGFYKLITDTQYSYSSLMKELNQLINTRTVGASGAIYGLLLAFGVLFPNVEMYIMFIPIPIKAKYLVIFFIISELYLGFIDRPGDNTAHFAHLGGMLFGLILLYFWRKKQFKRWD